MTEDPILAYTPLSPPMSTEASTLMRFFSWNVNGARAIVKKDSSAAFLRSMMDHPEMAAIGVQEIKADLQTLPTLFNPESESSGFCSVDSCSIKKGYSGTWAYTREGGVKVTKGIGNEELDAEGRCITMEFESLYFVTAYVPNSGTELKRLDERCEIWEAQIRSYLKSLDLKKPVIYCGDMNVACADIELANPKSNYNKSPGFTQKEIDAFNELIKCGFTDAFRHLYPESPGCYTYWGYRHNARAKNIGWRLDYFLCSSRIIEAIKEVVHHTSVQGSDHCPIEIQIDIAKLKQLTSNQ
eukprot:GHVH01016952.1.p1 GENE.GHVH01016952.1~~GHVH01016952.1.p1  ORF type:complete len:298 (+),score=40.34 GHVH01016952.1:941-1834(+)